MRTAEVWKEVPNTKGKYLVSNLGRVAKTTPTTIPTRVNQVTGYTIVDLALDGKKATMPVHRLVASAFCERGDNHTQVNHKNGIKTDNRAQNLEWCTSKENAEHKNKVLKNYLHIPVVCIETGVLYETGISASQAVGLKASGEIFKCCRNIKGFHTAGGYHWRFATDNDILEHKNDFETNEKQIKNKSKTQVKNKLKNNFEKYEPVSDALTGLDED